MGSGLQQFEIQNFRCTGTGAGGRIRRNIGREFPYLVDLTIITILVGDGQDVIGLQGLVDGDKAYLGIKVIVRGIQFPGIYDLKVLYLGQSPVNSAYSLPGRRLRLVGSLMMLRYFGVRIIVGIVHTSLGPDLRVVRISFSQVHQTDDLAGPGIDAVAVGHPDLDAKYLYLGSDDRQFRHGLVIVIPEVLGQQEVAVFFVVISLERKGGYGRSALGGKARTLGPADSPGRL